MNNNFINGDMIRGHIDTIILLSLMNEDKHTNEIRDEIENKAGGKYKVKQGTFYSALQRLSKQGFVSEYRSSTADSIRRKYFHLTEKGKKYVEENIDKWNYSKSVIDDMISDDYNTEKEEKIIVTPTENAESEFEELLKNSNNIEDYESLSENDELDDYFKQLNSTLQSELIEMTKVSSITEEPIVKQNLDNKDLFDKLLETTEVRNSNNLDYEEHDNNDNDYENSNFNEVEFASLLTENSNNFEDELVLPEESTEEYQEYTEEIDENISILDEDDDRQLIDEPQESSIQDNTSVLLTNDEEVFDIEKELSIEENNKVEEEIVQIDTLNLEENSLQEETIQQESEENITEDVNIDNSYALDDKFLFGKDENRELYSDLLDTLFSSSSDQQEQEFNEPEQVEYYEDSQESYQFENIISQNFQEENCQPNIEESSDLEIENLNFENDFKEKEENFIIEEPKVVDKITETKPAYSYSLSKENFNTSFKIDYSDIVAYASEEGFKVRTSYTTNKSEIGKVLINKLSFHTSLLFLIISLIQLSIIFFVFKPTTILHFNFYIISALFIFSIVLINAVFYIINKGRSLSKLSTFKNTLEVAFIICLNLILLICAYAIISDINFTKAEDLVRYIIIPILFVLNIPVYFIIKYILLENNTYYTK